MIADAAVSGSGLGLNGDRAHVETQSAGFVSGVRFDGNDVNSNSAGYVAPFIRTFTPNVGISGFLICTTTICHHASLSLQMVLLSHK